MGLFFWKKKLDDETVESARRIANIRKQGGATYSAERPITRAFGDMIKNQRNKSDDVLKFISIIRAQIPPKNDNLQDIVEQFDSQGMNMDRLHLAIQREKKTINDMKEMKKKLTVWNNGFAVIMKRNLKEINDHKTELGRQKAEARKKGWEPKDYSHIISQLDDEATAIKKLMTDVEGLTTAFNTLHDELNRLETAQINTFVKIGYAYTQAKENNKAEVLDELSDAETLELDAKRLEKDMLDIMQQVNAIINLERKDIRNAR